MNKQLRQPVHASLNIVRRMASSADEVLFQTVKDKGVITLNRPKALNAINYNMIKQITPTLRQWDGDKSLIIMKGAGKFIYQSMGFNFLFKNYIYGSARF